MFLFSPTSIPNFKLEQSQLEKPLAIPYDIPPWKREKLINLLSYGFREKNPILMEINWGLVGKELEIHHRPQGINAFKLLKNEIIIIEIETEEQLQEYTKKYNRLPVLLTIAVLKNLNLRASRKWISDLKIMLIESVQKTIFCDKLIEPKLFIDFPFFFVLQSFEDPIDCIDFLSRAIKKRTLQSEKNINLIKIDDGFLQSIFCEVIADQLKELNSDQLQLLYSLTLTSIPEELSELASLSREEVMKIAEELSSKGFVHLYGNLVSPTAPIKKFSEPKYFENLGKLLRDLIPDKFNSTEEIYSKILQSMQPSQETFSRERTISDISTAEIMPSINISAIKSLIKVKISKIGFENLVDIDDIENLRDICSRILWKERDGKKRKVLFSARSLAYLTEKNIEKSLKDASMIEGDDEYINILRRLYLENSKLLSIQGKWNLAIEILKKAIESSRDIDETQANLIVQLGSVFISKGEYEEAINLLNKSKKTFEELENKSGIVTTIHQFGNVNDLKGKYAEQSDVGRILNNLGNLLSKMGRIEEAKQRYEGALEIYKTLLIKDPDDVEYKSYVGMVLHNLGTLLSKMGRLEEAKQRYEDALEIYKTLLINDPDNVKYKSYVGTTLNNLGALLSYMGRIEEAKQRFEGALKIHESLLIKDPDNIGYQSDVGAALNNLGALLSDMGRIEEAKQRFEGALKIREALLNTDPDNVGYQSYIGTTLNNLGTLLSYMGRIEEAKQRYEAALEIYKTLLNTDPGNVGYQSYVGTTLNNLGTLLSKMGRTEEAKQRFEGALEIRETLLSTDPDNVGYQSDLGTTLNNLGALLFDMGRIEEAKQRYEAALEIYKTLFNTDPNNVGYKSYMGMTLNNLGNLLSNMGRVEEAKQKYESALKIREALLSTDPDNVRYQSDVGITLNNLGNLLSDMGRIEEAKQRFEGALKIRETLLSTDSNNVGYQSDVGMTLNNLGTLLFDMGRIEEAKQRYEGSLKIYKTLLNKDLDNVGYKSGVGATLTNLGNLLSKIGRVEEAKQKYESALKIREALLSTDPDNVRYQSDVGMTSYNLGTLLSGIGKYEDALKSYERGLSLIGADNPYSRKIRDNIINLSSKMKRK